MMGRGIAVADVDGDGRLDFIIAGQWGDSYLYKNEAASSGSFLGLHLLLPVQAGLLHFRNALGIRELIFMAGPPSARLRSCRTS